MTHRFLEIELSNFIQIKSIISMIKKLQFIDTSNSGDEQASIIRQRITSARGTSKNPFKQESLNSTQRQYSKDTKPPWDIKHESESKNLSSKYLLKDVNKFNTETYSAKDSFIYQVKNNTMNCKAEPLNDILKQMGEKKQMNPSELKNRDGIKQIDHDALLNVIRMTNQCKIIASLISSKQEQLSTHQILKYTSIQSFNRIKQINKILNERQESLSGKHSSYKMLHSPRGSQNQLLKKEIANLKKTVMSLQQQKSDLRMLASNQKIGNWIKVGTPLAKAEKEKKLGFDNSQTQLKKQLDQLKETNAKLKKESNHLQNLLKDRQLEISKLKKEYAKEKNEVDSLSKQKNDFLEEKNRLIDEKNNMRKQNIELQNTINQKINYSRKLEENQKQHKEKIKNLESQLAVMGGKCAKLNEQRIILHEKLKQTMESSEKLNKDILKQREQHLAKANKLQIQIQNNEKKIESILSDNKETTLKLEQLSYQITILKQKYIIIKNENNQLTEKDYLLTKQNKGQNERIIVLERESSILEKELISIKKQNNSLQLQLNTCSKEKDKMVNKSNSYKSEVDYLTHQVELLHQTLQQANIYNKSMQGELKPIDPVKIFQVGLPRTEEGRLKEAKLYEKYDYLDQSGILGNKILKVKQSPLTK